MRWGGGCYDQEENVLRANETQYCLKILRRDSLKKIHLCGRALSVGFMVVGFGLLVPG